MEKKMEKKMEKNVNASRAYIANIEVKPRGWGDQETRRPGDLSGDFIIK
jgi:hypothetical protein